MMNNAIPDPSVVSEARQPFAVLPTFEELLTIPPKFVFEHVRNGAEAKLLLDCAILGTHLDVLMEALTSQAARVDALQKCKRKVQMKQRGDEHLRAAFPIIDQALRSAEKGKKRVMERYTIVVSALLSRKTALNQFAQSNQSIAAELHNVQGAAVVTARKRSLGMVEDVLACRIAVVLQDPSLSSSQRFTAYTPFKAVIGGVHETKGTVNSSDSATLSSLGVSRVDQSPSLFKQTHPPPLQRRAVSDVSPHHLTRTASQGFAQSSRQLYSGKHAEDAAPRGPCHISEPSPQKKRKREDWKSDQLSKRRREKSPEGGNSSSGAAVSSMRDAASSKSIECEQRPPQDPSLLSSPLLAQTAGKRSPTYDASIAAQRGSPKTNSQKLELGVSPTAIGTSASNNGSHAEEGGGSQATNEEGDVQDGSQGETIDSLCDFHETALPSDDSIVG